MTFWSPDGTSLMFFQVETRTTIKISAATIQVQIIELVTGNPNTLKISSAAEGTFGSADAAGAATDWAFIFITAKIAKRNAPIKMILLKCFTVKIDSDETNDAARQTAHASANAKSAES